MKDSSPLRVLVLDDHPMFANALGEFLRVGRPDLEIIAVTSFADGLEVLTAGAGADLVLADLHMPGMAGGVGLVELQAAAPQARIAIVSGEAPREGMAIARRYGAVGFIAKTLRPSLMRAAAMLIAEGGAFFPDEAEDPAEDSLPAFSERERAVLRAIAAGEPNKTIATKLGLQEVTIKTHVGRILAKTGLRNRVQLAMYATKHGLG
jgi:two-component system nitrate/nitrite response regulator NarL